VVLLAAAPAADVPPADLVFRHVAVVDVERGRIIPDQAVAIRGRTIVGVSRDDSTASAAGPRVIDGSGLYLVPGLWDMHAHVLDPSRWSWGSLLNVANGITGIRDPATVRPLADVAAIRAAIESGTLVAPRIVTGGPLIDGPPPVFKEFLTIDSGDAMRREVRRLHAQGADFIKLYNRLSRDSFLAAMEESRRLGLPVAGHVPVAVGAAEASDLGMRSVEHSFRHRMACSRDEAAMRRKLQEQVRAAAASDWTRYWEVEDAVWRLGLEYSGEACLELGRTFARNGTWFVPTAVEMMSRFRPEITSEESLATLFDDPRLVHFPARRVAQWREQMAVERGEVFGRAKASGDPIGTLDRVEKERAAEVANRLRMTLDLHRGGTRLLAGTDASFNFPLVLMGFSLHEELELMVRSGLDPADALRTATLNPAVFLGLSESLGAIAPGKSADLVLLAANPLEDIRNTTKITAVVLRGRYLDRPALDRLLDEARVLANPPP
jgi:imidazolonepropionase-like amidohydrolase